MEYSDNFEEMYTTKLVANNQTEAQKREAQRIAAEIEGQAATNTHIAEERGQASAADALDPEDRYSGVLVSEGKGYRERGALNAAQNGQNGGKPGQDGEPESSAAIWGKFRKPKPAEPEPKAPRSPQDDPAVRKGLAEFNRKTETEGMKEFSRRGSASEEGGADAKPAKGAKSGAASASAASAAAASAKPAAKPAAKSSLKSKLGKKSKLSATSKSWTPSFGASKPAFKPPPAPQMGGYPTQPGMAMYGYPGAYSGAMQAAGNVPGSFGMAYSGDNGAQPMAAYGFPPRGRLPVSGGQAGAVPAAGQAGTVPPQLQRMGIPGQGVYVVPAPSQAPAYMQMPYGMAPAARPAMQPQMGGRGQRPPRPAMPAYAQNQMRQQQQQQQQQQPPPQAQPPHSQPQLMQTPNSQPQMQPPAQQPKA